VCHCTTRPKGALLDGQKSSATGELGEIRIRCYVWLSLGRALDRRWARTGPATAKTELNTCCMSLAPAAYSIGLSDARREAGGDRCLGACHLRGGSPNRGASVGAISRESAVVL